MDFPQRKNNRLSGYDYSQSGAYYITLCTQNRLHLFGEIVGATLCGRPDSAEEMVEKWLLEILNKYNNIVIDKYVIMPNHLHCIVILTGDHIGSPLPQIVNWFKTMTTNEYIRGVKKGWYPPYDKRVWQRSYHDHIIRNEKEYQQIWKYIDENPIGWEQDCLNEKQHEL